MAFLNCCRLGYSPGYGSPFPGLILLIILVCFEVVKGQHLNFFQE